MSYSGKHPRSTTAEESDYATTPCNLSAPSIETVAGGYWPGVDPGVDYAGDGVGYTTGARHRGRCTQCQ